VAAASARKRENTSRLYLVSSLTSRPGNKGDGGGMGGEDGVGGEDNAAIGDIVELACVDIGMVGGPRSMDNDNGFSAGDRGGGA